MNLEYNYDALNIIFKINNNEDKKKLLYFSYQYFRQDKNIQDSLINGWNSYVTLNGGRWMYYDEPSIEFIKECNTLLKHVRRKRLIDNLITENP